MFIKNVLFTLNELINIHSRVDKHVFTPFGAVGAIDRVLMVVRGPLQQRLCRGPRLPPGYINWPKLWLPGPHSAPVGLGGYNHIIVTVKCAQITLKQS